jgi:hypothetical protein
MTKAQLQQLIDDSIDNTGSGGTTGQELIAILKEILDFAQPLKMYLALLFHTGDPEPPTATVLYNTLGGEITYEYEAEGLYQGVGAGLFPDNRTAIQITNSDVDWTSLTFFIDSNGINGTMEDFFRIRIENGGGGLDVNFSYLPILILVKP